MYIYVKAELDIKNREKGVLGLEALTKSGAGQEGYTIVEDVAGKYIQESEKLKLLKKRYFEITGSHIDDEGAVGEGSLQKDKISETGDVSGGGGVSSDDIAGDINKGVVGDDKDASS
jgi:hypothetical protein